MTVKSYKVHIYTQVVPTSFGVEAAHEGYYFRFDYLYKLSYLTSNLAGNVTIGYYIVVQEYQHAYQQEYQQSDARNNIN